MRHVHVDLNGLDPADALTLARWRMGVAIAAELARYRTDLERQGLAGENLEDALGYFNERLEKQERDIMDELAAWLTETRH